jgi:AraC-like DNA-binding protein
MNPEVHASANEWQDETIHSPRDSMVGVQAPGVEKRPWFENFPICQALSQYQILHIGIHQAHAPTRIVRRRQTTTYFLACMEGRGRVLIDGRWRICAEGEACLLPAHTLNAFEAIKGEVWNFCWVCYARSEAQRPLADATEPLIARFDSRLLSYAVQGTIRECEGAAQPGLIQAWVGLVQGYVERFANPLDQPDQLKLLWERVASDLAADWSLARLEAEAGYSSEHLRRLCRRQLGRSPMHHVTYLRMKRAAELLVSTDKTIGAICQEVGYQNPFVFSNSFTKWVGWRPSEYRRKKS